MPDPGPVPIGPDARHGPRPSAEGVSVRPATAEDAEAWLTLRRALWPEEDEDGHRAEVERYFAGEFPRWPWTVLLAEDAGARTLGFAEVAVRNWAEGCVTPAVAYLEGWYVRPEARRRGVGRALVAAAEAWGRERGCTEMGSDADPRNAVSIAAHRGSGFEDAGMVRCFRKDLALEDR